MDNPTRDELLKQREVLLQIIAEKKPNIDPNYDRKEVINKLEAINKEFLTIRKARSKEKLEKLIQELKTQ